MITVSDRAPEPTWVQVKPHQLHGQLLSSLREAAGISRAEAARIAGINHATLRLAELEFSVVRLTQSNAAAMLKAYHAAGLIPWITNPRPGLSLSEMVVNIEQTTLNTTGSSRVAN